LWFVMSLMAVQMLSLCAFNAAMARDVVSTKAKSVACLMNAATLALFVATDASYVLSPNYPAAFPKEGVYFNLALFAALGVMCLSGWAASGSATPDFTALVPIGRFGLPYAAGCANLLFFGVPLVFFREAFIEMYPAAAVRMGELTPDLRFFAMWMFGNVGKFILANVATGLAVVSTPDAPAAREDTLFRALRAGSMVYMFYLGSMSKDCIINQLNGAVDPMRVMTVVQSFAITFWQVNAWAGAGFTLKKAK